MIPMKWTEGKKCVLYELMHKDTLLAIVAKLTPSCYAWCVFKVLQKLQKTSGEAKSLEDAKKAIEEFYPGAWFESTIIMQTERRRKRKKN